MTVNFGSYRSFSFKPLLNSESFDSFLKKALARISSSTPSDKKAIDTAMKKVQYIESKTSEVNHKNLFRRRKYQLEYIYYGARAQNQLTDLSILLRFQLIQTLLYVIRDGLKDFYGWKSQGGE